MNHCPHNTELSGPLSERVVSQELFDRFHYKYYVAYKLLLAAQEVERKAREQVTPGKN